MEGISLSTILSYALTLFGGSFGMWLVNIYRAKNESKLNERKTDLQEDQQIFNFYKDLVQTLNANVTAMRSELAKLSSDHALCQERNAKLEAQVMLLQEKVKTLEEKVKNNIDK
jgi:hypothetical protein